MRLTQQLGYQFRREAVSLDLTLVPIRRTPVHSGDDTDRAEYPVAVDT